MEVIDVNIYLLEVACERNWQLQPDLNKRQKIMENMVKKSWRNTILCPCKVYVEGLVELADVKCPCTSAQKDIEDHGICHCNLFLRRDALDHA
jgi:ferredoxin-thioredoxin reductase catalytic chain